MVVDQFRDSDKVKMSNTAANRAFGTATGNPSRFIRPSVPKPSTSASGLLNPVSLLFELIKEELTNPSCLQGCMINYMVQTQWILDLEAYLHMRSIKN